MLRGLRIPATPGLKVCGFCHDEHRREAREEVTVVLAIGHALRAHEALGRPDTLSGFLEVVHRLFEDGVFVGHARSIRASGSCDHQIVSPSPASGRGKRSGDSSLIRAGLRDVCATCFPVSGQQSLRPLRVLTPSSPHTKPECAHAQQPRPFRRYHLKRRFGY